MAEHRPGAADLGAALRAWRDRRPAGRTGNRLDTVGSRVGDSARRTPGLRREEVARAAGISVDYLARLEQNRVAPPSSQVLRALTRALDLDADEREYLFLLAQRAPEPARMQTTVPPSTIRMIDQLTVPAAAYDAAWTMLRWNRSFAALLGDPEPLTNLQRNVVYRQVCGCPSRVVRAAGGDEIGPYVADLRRTRARFPRDPHLDELLAALARATPRWPRLWADAPAGALHETRKRVRHPLLGEVDFDCDMLTVVGSDVRVALWTTTADSVLARLPTVPVTAVGEVA